LDRERFRRFDRELVGFVAGAEHVLLPAARVDPLVRVLVLEVVERLGRQLDERLPFHATERPPATADV